MRANLPAATLLADPQVRHQAMNSVFDSIFARDIATRGQLRDTEAVTQLNAADFSSSVPVFPLTADLWVAPGID